MSQKDSPRYELDADTKELVEVILEMAQRTVDIQYSDDSYEDLQSLLVECARRFYIPTHKVTTEVDDDGRYTINVEQEGAMLRPKWKPRVIDGDKPDKA